MTVVVHSFVADSSLLDLWFGFCLFVCLFFLFFFFSSPFHLCLQVGNRLGFWGGFSCFVSFIWCQLFACLIRAAIFRLPPAFVVCSFFLCHRHLCTVSFFHGLFCRRHSCQTFCLCLVSACFRVSVYLSVFGIMLCACCSSASSLEIRTGILPKSVTLWTALQIPLWSKPHLYSAIKFTKSHSAKCSLHKWAWLRRSINFISFELYKLDPSSPHSGSIPRELVHSYALGCLWVVTVCCNTVGRHG